jgi:hypothetical protein
MRCTCMASTAGALYTLGYTPDAAEPKAQRLANHRAETQINNIRFSAKRHISETLQSSQGRHATHGSSNKTECTHSIQEDYPSIGTASE